MFDYEKVKIPVYGNIRTFVRIKGIFLQMKSGSSRLRTKKNTGKNN
jgi:hypothetical protein